jgi:hypothetical protein
MKQTSLSIMVFLFLLSVMILAQKKKVTEVKNGSFAITIADSQAKYLDSTKNNFTVRDFYEYLDPSKPGTFKLPSEDILVAIPPNSHPEFKAISKSEVTFNNIVPALNEKPFLSADSTIKLKKVYQINTSNAAINQPIVEMLGFIWFRDFYCAHLKIHNYTFDATHSKIREIKELTIEATFKQPYSFVSSSPIQIKSKYDAELNKLIYNSDIAEQFRSNPNMVLGDSTGGWIDYNATYFKIGTASDGLFRIYKSDLEEHGINTSGINPQTFQLFKKGKDIPIYVSNETSGIFGDNDYIEFFGTKNYPAISYREINKANQDYNEYLDRYTDTTFFFLTWNNKNGNRVVSDSTNTNSIRDTLDYHYQLQHFEKNTMYQNLYDDEVDNQTPGWFRNKTWYWDWLFVQKRNYSFQTPDLYPNKPANFYFKLVSCASNVAVNSHNLAFSVNGIEIDSQVVNRFQQVLLHGTVNSNQLINGTNQMATQSFDNGTSPNQIANDWYDMEYPRYLLLQNDSLYFKVDGELTKSLRIIKIGNAHYNDYVIYRITPTTARIKNYRIVSGSIVFADTVSGNSTYVINRSGKITRPVFYYAKRFTNLRNTNVQADYVAISHSKFVQQAQNYLNTLSSYYNLTTKLFNVQDIFDEFGYGFPTPESIKLFVQAAFQNWQTPKPTYLTLIGDADYDYKHYRFINDGVVGGGNYVPSFGNPVSDNWYAVWADQNINLPQLIVGRIPINSTSDLDYYLSKITNNVNSSFSEFNKHYLFFSGGYGSDPNEFKQLKSENDSIIVNVIQPKPVSGIFTHFYKTISPPSDLGPYTRDQIQSALSIGGLFISYLGHSGTATWDNGINETNQLLNNVNRNPIITDFGCSTNKFAEPDIISFGERFVLSNSGQALNYVGNTSLGFTSTAFTVPQLFYQSLIQDSLHVVGNAQLSAKMKMYEKFGSSNVFKIFALTNTIIGDPAVRVKVPNKPNLILTNSDILFANDFINENDDSALVKIVVRNLGLAYNETVDINVAHLMGNTIIETKKLKIPMPDYIDTVKTWLKVKSLPGNHEVTVTIDPDNKIDEIYKSDNSVTTSFFVSSQAVRDLLPCMNENSALSQFVVLNPSQYSRDQFNIILQVSDNPLFNNLNQYSIRSQSFYSGLPFNSLKQNNRYWFKYKIDEPSAVFSLAKSSHNSGSHKFLLIDSLSFCSQNLTKLKYSSNGLLLSKDSVKISILSAGFYTGATCVIAKNGTNLLSNSFFAGMGIAVFDEKTMHVDTTAWYQMFGQPANVQRLADMINAIPEDKIVVIGVADDARNNLSAALKNAIKTLGSTKIDSLAFRGSWAIIGKKGASASDIIEKVKGPYNGSITLEKSFIAPNSTGDLITKQVGPAAKWESLYYRTTTPSDSKIDFSCLGIRNNGNVDTLKNITYADSTASLSQIDPKVYPKLMFMANYKAATDGTTPELKRMAVDYVQPPELGLNYQTVSLSTDSVFQGNSLTLDYSIYNIGESDADSFKVNVYLNLPNKSQKLIFDTLITKLVPFSKISKKLDYNSNFDDGYGQFSFLIMVDKEQKVLEVYKDNNFFNKPFYVVRDSITAVNTASISYTFDGLTILDGDYVSPKPKIEFKMNYNYHFPYRDTSKINFILDGRRYLYSMMDSIHYDTINRVVIYQIRPQLHDGEHSIKVTGDGLVNQPGELQNTFFVSSELKILDVYNYPNPFKSDTYFTFNLSVIPDEITLKIFTVAGRLIKEIKPSIADLNVNFNRVYWDGRDEDGDILANGVYLYKVIAKLQDKTCSNIQKLAKVQ